MKIYSINWNEILTILKYKINIGTQNKMTHYFKKNLNKEALVDKKAPLIKKD